MEYLGYTAATREVIVRMPERNYELLQRLALKLQAGVRDVNAEVDYTNLWRFLRESLESEEAL